jgi:regulator of CtrA degradation
LTVHGVPPLWQRAAMSDDSSRAKLTPKLIDSLYVEAMVLADEARAYFDQHGRGERLALEPIIRVGFSCESLKVTTRLMHVIAWLLTQRAVEAGELSDDQAQSPARQLGDEPTSDPVVIAQLPEDAVQLIEASRELYARVGRLAEGGGFDAASSPARSLMSRLERSL